jgi:hypothetical protein
MKPSPAFWAAFFAGLAGPLSLYEAPPIYSVYGNSIAQIFSGVGMLWTYTSAPGVDDRPAADTESAG